MWPSHSKWQRVEQWICIKFCIQLEHSSAEIIRMIQKAAAMGTWWWAASSRQCTASCITSCAKFFGQTSNHPGDSAPLQPRFGTLQLLAFPKLKWSLKQTRFQTMDEIQENMMGQLMALGELCKVPSAYFEGNWGIIVLFTMFLVPCISCSKCLWKQYNLSFSPLHTNCFLNQSE